MPCGEENKAAAADEWFERREGKASLQLLFHKTCCKTLAVGVASNTAWVTTSKSHIGERAR